MEQISTPSILYMTLAAILLYKLQCLDCPVQSTRQAGPSLRNRRK